MDEEKRKGNTEVTSVSLTKEFRNIMRERHISPSSAMRKGIAVCLYEMGDARYQSPINQQRYQAINDFLKSQMLKEALNSIESKILEIRKTIQEFDGKS